MNGLIVADSGPIFSLACIKQLHLLDVIFVNVLIPEAVWKEVTKDVHSDLYPDIYNFFKTKVRKIKSLNDLVLIMDEGESEAVILYKELFADFLLIDDKKARKVAEYFDLNCIGTLGLLIYAKENGHLSELKTHFEVLLKNNRYYSISLLNNILGSSAEDNLL